MAFVSDISGVWSSRDTRRMTPSPMKVASTKTYTFGQRSTSAPSRQRFARARVPDLAVVRDERARLDVVVEVEPELLLVRERLDERRQVAGEEEARMEGQRRGQVERGQDRHPARLHRLARFRQLAVAAAV